MHAQQHLRILQMRPQILEVIIVFGSQDASRISQIKQQVHHLLLICDAACAVLSQNESDAGAARGRKVGNDVAIPSCP